MSPKSAAVVRALAPTAAPAPRPSPVPAPALGPVEALRSHLAGKSAREHVVLDFLEDDLAEARAALAAVAAYVANVEAALRDPEPSQHRFLSLAIGGAPIEKMENLAQSVSSVRRRLAHQGERPRPVLPATDTGRGQICQGQSRFSVALFAGRLQESGRSRWIALRP